MNGAQHQPGDIGKQRIEALSDGLYAITLTLLVLDLKLHSLGAAAANADLLHALRELMPKVLTRLLSFWVMAVLWLSQVRVYRWCVRYAPKRVWLEHAGDAVRPDAGLSPPGRGLV